MDGIGELFRSLGDAITNLMRGVVDALQGAVQGLFHTFESLLPFPWWLVALGLLLLCAAWVLAKR